MKATRFFLLFCFAFELRSSHAWAGPTDLFASASGGIVGKDSLGNTVSFVGEPLSDFDTVNASTDPGLADVSGSTDGASANVTGGAIAKHPPERGEPGLLGVDLTGAVGAARPPIIGSTLGAFDSAGQLTASMSVSAEYHDVITLEFTPDDTPLTLEGIVFLDGFASLDAVATGGIDPHNVRATLGGALSGTNGLGSTFGTTKFADGEIAHLPGTTNILELNPVIDFGFDLISGVPFEVFMKLSLNGSAEFGDGLFTHKEAGTARASFEAHFGNTLRWGEITRVVNRRTGEEVTDWRIHSASGFDYSQSFSVPEPPTFLLAALAGIGLLAVRRRGAAVAVVALTLGVVVAGLVVASTSLAADDSWKTAANGVWGAGSSWTDGTTPGASDSATFNLPGTYTVTFNADPPPIQALTLTSAANVTFASGSRPPNPIEVRTLPVTSAPGSEDVILSDGATLTLGEASGGLPLVSHPFHLTAGRGLAVQNGATLNVSFGSDVVTTDFNLHGRLNVSGSGSECTFQFADLPRGGSLNVAAGGLFEGLGAGIGGLVSVSGANSRINLGSLTVGSIGGGGKVDINSGGAVSVSQDMLLLMSGFVDLAGGTLDAGDISFFGAGGGFIWTSGTLHVGIYHGDLLNQGGTLAPGHSAGDTLILGDYQQRSKGTLEIEIGGLGQGTQFDFVNVTGNALVDGTLDLKLIDGFVPTPSQSFVVLSANNLLGVFDNAGNGQRVATSDGRGSFLVQYGPGSPFDENQVILTAFQGSTGLPGDANGDGRVDLADFGILKSNFGSGTTLAEGDFNGDGKVDLADFGILKENFGKSGAAAVPEPATLVLTMLGVALLTIRRRGSRAARASQAGS